MEVVEQLMSYSWFSVAYNFWVKVVLAFCITFAITILLIGIRYGYYTYKYGKDYAPFYLRIRSNRQQFEGIVVSQGSELIIRDADECVVVKGVVIGFDRDGYMLIKDCTEGEVHFFDTKKIGKKNLIIVK